MADQGSSASAGRCLTVIDSSIQINYLGLGRLDLVVGHTREAVITPEVDQEIRRNREALEAALRSGQIRLVYPLFGPDEAKLFARLTLRLSAADASCIILALALGADLAVDDRACRLTAEAEIGLGRLLGTEDLLAEAVTAGILLVDEADELLTRLPSLRYLPRVASVRTLLDPPRAD